MFQKLAIGLVAAFALAALVCGTATAADKTHEGTVVSAAAGKLVMVDKDGKNEHTHTVGATTKVTLDGKAAKLEDLKKGDAVKVTADEAGKVSAIAATRGK
jgi:nitrous oxidase accessory protein NosD